MYFDHVSPLIELMNKPCREPHPSPPPATSNSWRSPHSLIPVTRTVTADLETPVSAFLRIASEAPEAFLLESVEGGEHVGRYTFIGIEPYKKMTATWPQHLENP